MITLKNKKQFMIIVLALFMTFTVFGGLLFTGLKKNVAKADGDTSYFAMEDGISIKLNEDGGMRFIAKMDTTIGEALINGEETMQFIIAPTALFDYADQNDMEYINLPKKIVVDVDKAKVYPDNADEPNYYYANGCVTKMYESNFNLTYEAVGYIVGERYTERNSNATGAYYEKVNATFLNQNLEEQILGLERYNSWYGTEKYPVAIKNQSQYEKIVEKCNAGNTAYKGKVIVAEGGVQWNDADFTNPATKPELSKTASILADEISAWDEAEVIGSALNSSNVAYKIGGYNVYKTTGGYGQSIVNTNIVATNHTELHFAFKVDKSVYLSSGNSNTVKANTWYFVKLEKQTGGNWTIAVKAFGESSYTTLEASTEFFGAGNATFEKMFRTYLWAGNNTDNHEVYATDVWGVTKVDEEIATWEAAGAIKLGSALNSSEALAETLGGLAIYKTNGGFNKSIANLSIDASNYTKLYFAYKTNKPVALSNTDGQNGNKAGVWYFVKLEKQADGSWTIAAKAFGDSSYTTLTANAQLFGTNATFDSMFKTNLWTNDAYNHEVYATDVWGVTIVGGEVATWEAAGAEKLGSALNSSEALAETLGGLSVYKTNGGFNYSIANMDIDVSNYTQLYFAYKTNKQVALSNTDNQNINQANTWYFVKLEKQADGNWTISVKVFGDSGYTELTAKESLFGANATFDSMFRTNLWAGDNKNNHEVYATDVWGK